MSRFIRTRARPLRPADFAADEAHVAYRGLIFRAGTYPAKGFAMTPADLAEVARSFEPVPIDLGHPSSASPLDGSMGRLTEVELSGDGTALIGRIEIPKWLDAQLGPAARKVSSSWDRATKRMRRLSLVTNPAIPDAVLEAAFAAHECTCHSHANAPTEEVAKMPSRLDALEAYVRARREAGDDDVDEAAVAAAVGMDYFGPDDGDDPGDPADAADDGGSSDFAARRIADLESQVADFAARIERQERAAIAAQAAEFATATIAAKKALPAERKTIERGYVHAALAERRMSSSAEFADLGTPSLVAQFAAAYEGRKPHYLFDDAVPGVRAKLPAGYRTLDPSGADRDRDRDRDAAEFGEEEVDEDTAYARRMNAKYLGKDRIAGNGRPAN